ncbi:MAG: SAM-dependent chlorinase/fluorinase [Chloroflexi bacterium]|uniref:SAM-dependent chlorinase/fluorinase n=1 Tax=Candidatus Chlorohelix allophototropha TaxID=3003348 RepID=A0A8T7MAA4_9CHLR|nr:SAM-dependent chlorinase/fluorinase [Chloroflexota bacterium]WJW69008.1 SAM-dependent chlorinase/fluorinase [Chloroflexota bacterium L227-S17]
MAVITLTTDFGSLDGYVGMMKGVIHAINPQATVIDLTHEVEPQNILNGAYHVFNAHRHFAPGTIHVAVVDPGVGTNRRAIGMKIAERGYFIGPDNGLFSYFLNTYADLQVRELNNPAFHLSEISNTFHGRDIFAPVAAFLSRDAPFEQVGAVFDPSALVRLENILPEWHNLPDTKKILKGRVLHIDHFGNVISNIRREHLTHFGQEALNNARVSVPGQLLANGIRETYGTAENGEIIALFGSGGYLEIAQVNEQAAYVTTLIENSVYLKQRVVQIGFPFEVELPYWASNVPDLPPLL